MSYSSYNIVIRKFLFKKKRFLSDWVVRDEDEDKDGGFQQKVVLRFKKLLESQH